MLNISSAFKRKLYNDEREFINRLDITLDNGRNLIVTNEHIMGSGGLEIEDAVSDDDNFSALGATIINAAEVVLYNNDEIYSDYDFKNAEVVIYTALNVDTVVNEQEVTIPEEIKKGTFRVDEAVFDHATIRLSLLDYMEQFDRSYSESILPYPASLSSIVSDLCTICGVTLANSSQRFPHYQYEVEERPIDEHLTCREVLGYVATIAGCFARFNVDGELELKWFDTNTLYNVDDDLDGGTLEPWTEGNITNGGTMNPWTSGTTKSGGLFTDNRLPHYITSLWSQDISVDDVVITGVVVTIEVDNDDEEESTSSTSTSQYLIAETENTKTYRIGTEGYVIEIENNPFFTESNVDEILTWLGTLLIGLVFRKCNVTHQSDPSIEAGDIGYVWDSKGVEHPILITRVTFSPNSPQTIVCGASTPSRNSADRYVAQTKSYDDLRKKLKERIKDSYAKAMRELEKAVANANGMYYTEVTKSGAVIRYLHDKPDLDESHAVIEFSNVGVTVTPDYQKSPSPDWYGLTVDGTLLASVINTIGLFFDYAHGGTLKLGGNANINGKLEIYDSTGRNLIGEWGKDGLFANTGGKLQSANGRVYFDLDNNEIAANKITNNSLWSAGNVTIDTELPSSSSWSTEGFVKIYNSSAESTGVVRIKPGTSSHSKGCISAADGLILRYGTVFYDSIASSEQVPYISILQDSITLDMGTNQNKKLSISQYGVDAGANLSCINFSMSGTFTYKGQAVTPSDRNLKKNIKPITQKYIDAIGSVELQEYEYKDEDGIRFGAVAQDVIESFEKEGLDWKESSIVKSSRLRPEDDEFHGLNYMEFMIIRLAYDEQIIEKQKQEIDDLKERVEKLEKLIAEKLL